MRKLLIGLPALLMVGCASFEADIERRPLEVNQALITIIPDETEFDSAWYNGDATWYDENGLRHCTIRLRDYPYMLGHETDHCFRGEWHDGQPNDDDHG